MAIDQHWLRLQMDLHKEQYEKYLDHAHQWYVPAWGAYIDLRKFNPREMSTTSNNLEGE